ncbi:NDP-hexose 2,3-dehydratase family protein [Streptomyces sp. NPDC020800]|uniref:NDP-hexose 2,3-dehydratase family protein n=1 Tax=Streptomyces sp. NPDC020800 TaxID=3365092 RepID=UPI003797C596
MRRYREDSSATLQSWDMGMLQRWPRLADSGVDQEFLAWFERRVRRISCSVDRIPLAEMRSWHLDASTGNIKHSSGRFFTIEGLHTRTTHGTVAEWSQPIISQPEIGILGLLVRKYNGTLQCLIQAKMEPGNAKMMQLSPTVQATRSNYTQAHNGSTTRYLEYFTDPQDHTVLVDVLQSEQGSWFLRKRNRNMIVLVEEDFAVDDGYRWMDVRDLWRLLRVEQLINMDTRSVLSCLPDGDRGEPDTTHLLRWLTGVKSRNEVATRRVPLRGIEGWRYGPERITHESGLYFDIVGVSVTAADREVLEWDQPMLSPHGQGVVAFVVKNFDGAAHLAVQARFQAGVLDAAELGPTVQCTPANFPQCPPRFLDYVLGAGADRILFDTVLTEEGGRFYHSENRYMLVEADEDFPAALPPEFHWASVHQLEALLRHGYYVNVEARSLLACLQAVRRGA